MVGARVQNAEWDCLNVEPFRLEGSRKTPKNFENMERKMADVDKSLNELRWLDHD